MLWDERENCQYEAKKLSSTATINCVDKKFEIEGLLTTTMMIILRLIIFSIQKAIDILSFFASLTNEMQSEMQLWSFNTVEHHLRA